MDGKDDLYPFSFESEDHYHISQIKGKKKMRNSDTSGRSYCKSVKKIF